MTPLVEAIERCAFDAWPAEETASLDGWCLRSMRGVSRRANSVWPGDATGSSPLDARIDRAEQWYASRGLRPAFQLSPLSKPSGIDAALEARGYVVEAPVSIQVASARAVAADTPRVAARVDAHLTDDWFEISAHRGRFAAVTPTYRGLLDRLGARTRYSIAYVDGKPAGVGLGVVDTALGEGCIGVFSMLTLAAGRRQGVARAVLAALAMRAVAEGVERMYLQVERDNAPALALYARASFREAYGYHYRVRGA